ncbi:ClbS/DfsB family four-helix bundle protein [Porphyromonas sp. COT-290 OH860]|uniref:ClbS/DfsB family four-helix bundle protein n=1 Tax=Porphyromonas sp. COT-290 OH860 TaxID=1515615 RepID=UPI00052C9FC4|nr:ClbS/DfsB family four-helix bundle protein [Porphyromonas sp. COT-290 OH860]KGN83941.1 hypothetical protein HQ41_05585 [Porphyromonas sp. COT-290 OH860]
MPRPTTKAMLIQQSQENYEKLLKLINTLSPEEQEQTFSFEDRDRNLRDILIHLYEWHQLLLLFVQRNMSDISSPFLPEPYNWRTYPDMNVEIWRKHQSTPLSKAKELFADSHQAALQALEPFTDEALFTKQFFPWTGTTSLGSYFVSATSSHYDWAIKKLKRHIKTKG